MGQYTPRSRTGRSATVTIRQFLFRMLAKAILILSIFSVVFSQQIRPGGYIHDPTGDTGLPYEHDTTGDFGPYKLWKLRQEAKLQAEQTKRPITPAYEEPVQKPQRYQQPKVYKVKVKVQQPKNYQQPQAYQQQPSYSQVQPQTPGFISQATGLSPASDFSTRSYSYTAPTYAAQAQGVSFTYQALL